MPEVLEKPRSRKAAPAKPTLGTAIDSMWALREKKRALDAQIKTIEGEIKELESTMFELLDAQDTRKAEGKKASVAIGETVVANVEDWDALWPYIVKNKFFHLIQKRVSDPGMRELWALKKVVPGVQPFTKRTLSVRSL
jgi:hypothetical protein